jgi:hypothetical protein
VAAVTAGLLAATAAGFFGKGPDERPPGFKQLTFRRGWINLAFHTTKDRGLHRGLDGEPPEIFTIRTDTRESRPLGRHAAFLPCRRRDSSRSRST